MPGPRYVGETGWSQQGAGAERPPDPPGPARSDSAIPSLLRLASELSWRLVVVALAVAGLTYLLTLIWIVTLAVFVSLLLATALVPPVRFLERHGLPSALATAAIFVALLAGVAVLGLVVIPPMAGGFTQLGPVVLEGVDNLERWLTDGPLELSQDQLRRYRQLAVDQAGGLLRASTGGLLSGALALVETTAGLLLALVVCFFLVKDGPRLQRGALSLVGRHRPGVARGSAAAWRALGGYLRAAVLIGLFEAAVIGLTLFLVGSRLILPVAVLTFLGAFLPIVGAMLAGVVAVLVALVSGGGGDALVVAVVALVVQQLDGDVLAPLVYGRAVALHPVVIILVLAAGGSLAGIAGAFLAVPLTAMGVAAWGAVYPR